MGLRLSVRRQAWLEHVHEVADTFPGLIPVVKGNGYGFGRSLLMGTATSISDTIAVGTVFEAADVPADRVAMALTPHLGALPADLPRSALLTVGSVAQVESLGAHGWTSPVVVKLRSTMRRYGITPDGVGPLSDAMATHGLTCAAYALHLPLAGEAAAHLAEIEQWLPLIDPQLPISISHVDAAAYATLRSAHPERSIAIRSGTALWHGDKSLLHLTADVLDVHPVRAGDVAGYHATTVSADGFLVLVAAGSAHGVHALDDGRSPFHFARTRLALFESPHMHTSMLFVATDDPVPAVADRVDVQRPLTMTTVDEVEWTDD